MDSRHNGDGASSSSSGSVNKGHMSDKRRSKRGDDDMDRASHKKAQVANGANLSSSLHDSATVHSGSPLGKRGSGQISTNSKDCKPETCAPEFEPRDVQKAPLPQSGDHEHIRQSQVRLVHARPHSNLIRRDDSWQSLVSLTRAGKDTPTRGSALQGKYVHLRSIYNARRDHWS